MRKQVIRHHFPEINSTNTWVKEHASKVSDTTVLFVTADTQTAGRGRQGKHWISPPKVNFYGTFGVRWESPFLAQHVCVIVAEVLEQLGFHPQLKWPNDILLNGKKVCGILCERCDGVTLVGIGLNINMTQEMCSAIDQPCSSLFLESNKQWDIQKITHTIQEHFLDALENSFALHHYEKRVIHRLGDAMRIRQGTKIIEGSYAGLQEDGGLLLRNPNGEIQIFFAGEVN